MRIPRLTVAANVALAKTSDDFKASNKNMIPPLKPDRIEFTSTAGYLKKYVMLPDEIKKDLSPSDAIDMFKEFDRIANGNSKGNKVGTGTHAQVFQIPCLEDYYLLILTDTNYDKHTIFSNASLGSAVWCDKDNPRIQIIEKL